MVLVLIAFAIIYNINSEKRKLAAFHTIADMLNLTYQQDVKLPPPLLENPLFDRGFMPSANHFFTGKYNNVQVMIFNYEYEKLSGDESDYYLRTAVVFKDPKIKLPDFYLRPMSPGDKLFGKNDIRFEEDVDFSKRYFLSGPDSAALYTLFGSRQRQLLKEMRRKWAIGSENGYMVIYADDKMDEQVEPKPEEMRNYLDQAWVLFKELSTVKLSSG